MMKKALSMTVSTAVLITCSPAVLITCAHATEDYCVTVRNTPDGFLALREGPGTHYKVKARLRPGELLVGDSLGDDWTHIAYVPGRDGPEEKAKRFTQGYVATKFTRPVRRCPYDASAG